MCQVDYGGQSKRGCSCDAEADTNPLLAVFLMTDTAEVEIPPVYLVCCVFVTFVLGCVCVSRNVCVLSDNTHHSSLTFVICVVHREEGMYACKV